MKRKTIVVRKDVWYRRITCYLPRSRRFKGVKTERFPIITIGCFTFSSTSFMGLYKKLMKFKESKEETIEINCRLLDEDDDVHYRRTMEVRKIREEGIQPYSNSWTFDCEFIKWSYFDKCVKLIKMYKETDLLT
jgi:hypothetical protein